MVISSRSRGERSQGSECVESCTAFWTEGSSNKRDLQSTRLRVSSES